MSGLNQSEIIEMARQAGWSKEYLEFGDVRLERFAALVIAAERERCAKVCDEMDESFLKIYGTDYTDFQNDPRYLQMAADAIRKGE